MADIGACEYAFVELVSTGVTGNGDFHCEVRGEAAETCVIEASADLLNSTPMQTNILGAIPVPFEDASSKDYALRWYRALIVPCLAALKETTAVTLIVRVGSRRSRAVGHHPMCGLNCCIERAAQRHQSML